MEWQREIKNMLVHSNYGKLHVFSGAGKSKFKLDDLESRLKQQDIEFAPVNHEEISVDYLDAFVFKPSVEINLSRGILDSIITMRSFSLSEDAAENLARQVVEILRIDLMCPPKRIFPPEGDMMREEEMFYNMFNARDFNDSPRETYEASRYLDFLTSYKNLTDNEAFKRATEKFFR
ncbi:hypothetical protein HY450_02850 [Candidatus Pacearchaeota archaeon]|nr:hypothetical protein [Candidatus Pacearchaeota archaeon]